jgi:penicillin amidase
MPPASPPALATPPARLLLRWLALTAVLFLLLCALALFWFMRAARAALPQLDGSAPLPGLSAPVTVTRDRHGVPTIEASNDADLYLAQGYVTAQDRLWQLDISRRFAAGEIAEVLGPEFIAHDREQRILLLRARSEHAVQELSPRDRGFLEAYARGVNAYIDSRRARLPLEFRLLRYSPRPWTPADTLVIYANMVKELNHYSAWVALARERVLAKVGPELAAEMYPVTSPGDHPPGQDFPRPARSSPPPAMNPGDWPASAAGAMAPTWAENLRAGSNDWVISGAHTVSGKPLLSNDPHLGHQMPSLWYEAHLKSPEVDVAGVTLPGAPTVILGHNQRIAWGFTNIGPTVEDVFVERFNEQGEYQAPGGWRAPQREREVIHVKGEPDVQMEVVVTRHGPIITELVPGEKRALALQWTLYGPGALALPFHDVGRARNWKEFRQAFSSWVAPGQNVVYADVDGHIGYQATGRVPIRASGSGDLPVSGADDGHEWTGYIPFDRLPSVFDPPAGILATANGRITPDGYPYLITTEWEAPYRTGRIYQALQSARKLSAADMLALQTDVYSAFDRFCAEKFVYALDHVRQVTPRARQARDLLRNWDGRMDISAAAPTLEVAARQQLYRLLLEPRLGAAPAQGQQRHAHGTSWRTYDWFMWPVWMQNTLTAQPRHWLPPGYANYDELLAAALEKAIDQQGVPADLASWAWGRAHPVEIQHPVLGRIPVLRRWTGPGVQPQAGNQYTVKAAGRDFGPSERTTVDLSNLDASTLNVVTGQSGVLFSPYYMDQWTAWHEGRTFALPFSAAAVEATRAHRLVLHP